MDLVNDALCKFADTLEVSSTSSDCLKWICVSLAINLTLYQ